MRLVPESFESERSLASGIGRPPVQPRFHASYRLGLPAGELERATQED